MSLYLFLAVLVGVPQSAPPVSLEDRLFMPFVDLLVPAAYSPKEFAELRSLIERERDEKLKASKTIERQWKSDLDMARAELEQLNRSGSVDTPATGARRMRLHVDISALERGIRETVEAHDVTIPAQYDKQETRLWLIEHWPERRAEILRRIDEGESRQRRHGDVEDIGFRMIADDPDDDIEPGLQAVRQMTAAGWLPAELDDAIVQDYARRLANRIAVHSDLKVPLHVTVMDSRDLKIVALPGGFLYVSSGVLLAAHSESQLACVLSREIARIAARHAARAAKRSLVSKLFMPVAQIATGMFTPGLNPAAYYGIGYGIQGLNGVVEKVLDSSTEKYQKEADQLGAQYAWKAGFDPRGVIEFLDSLEGHSVWEFVSPAVSLRERLLNIFSEIEFLGPLPNPVPDSVEFLAIRQRLSVREP